MPKIQKKQNGAMQIFIYRDLKSVVKHYFFRGPINNRIPHGIDNKLNET